MPDGLPLTIPELIEGGVNARALKVVMTGAESDVATDSEGGVLPTYRKLIAQSQESLDSALVQVGVFTSVGLGLAATAEGEFFLVQSNDADSFADRYQKVSGAAVFTGKSTPATDAVRNNVLTSGERFDTSRVVGQVFNGATFIQPEGKLLGFTLPAGQNGGSTFITALLYFSREESARLDDKRIRIQTVFRTVAGMLADLPLSATFMQVFAGGSFYNNLGTLVSRRQDGNRIIIETEMVWDGTYTAVGPTYQLQGSTVAAKVYSLELESMSYRVLDAPGAVTNADATVQAAFGPALKVLETHKVLPMRPGVNANQISEMFQGAARIVEDGRVVGITIPVGSTGIGSYVLEDFDLTRLPAIPLAGELVRFRVVMETSVGFDRGMSIKGLTLYGDGDIPRELVLEQGTAYVNADSDTVQEGVMTLIGDETRLRPYMIVANGAPVSGTAQTVRMKSFEVEFIRDDADLLAFEKNIRVQQRGAIARAERLAKLSFSEAMAEGFRGGVEVNGGIFHRDANNRIDGWRIPASKSGAGTYVQVQAITPQLKADPRFANRLVKLHFFFDVTAGYSREIRVTMQAIFNKGTQNRLVGVSQALQILVTPTILYVEGVFLTQGDEEELRPFFIQQASTIANSEEVLSLRSYGYTFEDSSTDPSALGGAALTTLMRDMRNAAKVKNLGSVGSLKAYGRFQPQFFQGTTQLEVAGKKVDGWSIPAASTAQPTLLQYIFDWGNTPNMSLAGRTVRIRFITRPSVPYSRSFDVQVQWFRPTGAVTASVPITGEEISEGGTRRVFEVHVALDGTESGLGPYLQAAFQTAPSGQVETLEILDVEMAIIASPNGEAALPGENDALAMRYALFKASQASNGGELVDVQLYKNAGTGLMPSFVDTLASLSDASKSRRYQIMHHGGKQLSSDVNFQMRDFVDITGVNKSLAVFDAGVMPDSIALEDIQHQQSMYFNTTGKIRGITIIGANCRYPVHSDSGGGLKNRIQEIENCHIEHLGNDGARAYQASIPGGNPAAVWSSEHAWGCGNSSGMEIHFRDTTLKSPTSPLYWHTNGMFDRPSIVTATSCRIVCTKAPNAGAATYASVYVQPLGSFQQDQGIINTSLLAGDVVYDPNPWIAAPDLAHQCSNHAEIKLSGSGNSGVHPFRHVDRGERALRITSSNTTNASRVEVSGTAVPLLFGDGVLFPAVVSKPGAGGLRGYVYGGNDVGDEMRGYQVTPFSVRIGTRLGNTTASPKTLAVKLNGGATITHTFNQDYTNQTNAAILAQINATLGSAATADLFNPTMQYRPSWFDQENEPVNVSAVGIPMGSVVAQDASGNGVRLMTSADSRSVYAGVAWEDIYPGKPGRVKNGGHLFLSDVRRAEGGMTAAAGDTFSVDPAVPGSIVKGGAQGLLAAVRAGVLQVA